MKATLKFFDHLTFWLVVHFMLAHAVTAYLQWGWTWIWEWPPGGRAIALFCSIWIAPAMWATEEYWHNASYKGTDDD